MEFKTEDKHKLSLFSDLRSYSRHWIKEFIEAYKNEICLWQTKHPDYNNHILRNQAYDKLVEKLKEVESNPDRSMVVRKINSLRSAFRREFRKKCVRPDYEPRLWYYNALAFIADQQFTVKSHQKEKHEKEKKRLFSENFDDDEIDQQEQDQEHEHEHEHMQEHHEEISMNPYEEGGEEINVKEEHARMIEVSHVEDQDAQMITIEHQHGEKMIEIHSQREKETQQAVNSITAQQQQQQVPVHTIQIQTRDSFDAAHHDNKDHQLKVMNLYKPDCFPVLNTTMVKHDDEYDAIGVNVASKLRAMNPHQRIIAEKMISDVLFSGQLDSLTVSSKLNL